MTGGGAGTRGGHRAWSALIAVTVVLALSATACTSPGGGGGDDLGGMGSDPPAATTPPPPTRTPTGAPSSGAPDASPTPTAVPDDGGAPATPASAADLGEVGVPDGTRLEPIEGDLHIDEDGEVVDGIELAGCIHVRADDVVIRNSTIRCAGAHAIRFYEGVVGGVVEHSEVDGTDTASNGIKDGDGITVRANHIHGANDGIKLGVRSTYVGNLIEDLYRTADSHNDGMQMLSGHDVVIQGNVISSPGGTSAVMIKTDRGPIDGITIRSNLLSGGSFTLYVMDAGNGFGVPTDVVVEDNLFEEDGRFGPLRVAEDIELRGNAFTTSDLAVLPQRGRQDG